MIERIGSSITKTQWVLCTLNFAFSILPRLLSIHRVQYIHDHHKHETSMASTSMLINAGGTHDE